MNVLSTCSQHERGIISNEVKGVDLFSRSADFSHAGAIRLCCVWFEDETAVDTDVANASAKTTASSHFRWRLWVKYARNLSPLIACPPCTLPATPHPYDAHVVARALTTGACRFVRASRVIPRSGSRSERKLTFEMGRGHVNLGPVLQLAHSWLQALGPLGPLCCK
jgi:hypothetical protein